MHPSDSGQVRYFIPAALPRFALDKFQYRFGRLETLNEVADLLQRAFHRVRWIKTSSKKFGQLVDRLQQPFPRAKSRKTKAAKEKPKDLTYPRYRQIKREAGALPPTQSVEDNRSEPIKPVKYTVPETFNVHEFFICEEAVHGLSHEILLCLKRPKGIRGPWQNHAKLVPLIAANERALLESASSVQQGALQIVVSYAEKDSVINSDKGAQWFDACWDEDARGLIDYHSRTIPNTEHDDLVGTVFDESHEMARILMRVAEDAKCRNGCIC